MSKIEVSVVLPVWNGGPFLAEAIESITRQTFSALELLVIDDGSTDESREIASEAARSDPRIRVLSQAHGGIVSALNAGIAAARGRYIARMDADDVSEPLRLEKQITFLEAHSRCVAVGSNIEIIDQRGERMGELHYPVDHRDITGALLSARGGGLAHPSVVMRAEALRGVGGYRSGLYPCEDLDLWLRLMEVGDLANVGEPLLRHRRHPGSVGVRERERQLSLAVELVNVVRRRRGMEALQRAAPENRRSSTAIYHADCARIALKTGRRHAALRHARAAIGAEPLRLASYAALIACALPQRALLQLYRLLFR